MKKRTMTRGEFHAYIEKEIVPKCMGLLRTKGADYGGNEDVFAQIKDNAARLGIRTDQAYGVFFQKHYDAIMTHIRTQKLRSEPVDGRILDAINFLFLLYTHYKLEESAEKPNDPV